MSKARATLCVGCWQNMRMPVPLRGVASLPFRAFGVRPSRMNPNTCTICEMMFSRVMKARQITIDATVLFADLRGYTALTQSSSPGEIGQLLDTFYDAAAEAIWEYDGLLNKTMGDAVMAVFNFPIRREDHAQRAVLAARRIRETCKKLKASLGESAAPVGVGIGIDCGDLNFGEFGRRHHDLTVVGTVVNLAARAQAAAAAGEILVTESVRKRLSTAEAEDDGREYALKGFEEPTRLWAA